MIDLGIENLRIKKVGESGIYALFRGEDFVSPLTNLEEHLASMIEELKQRLAAAEAKIPKWVPIRKGITYPSNDIRILVITKNSEVLTAHVTKEVIVPDDWFQGPVTHWMPLPEAPESGKGD